MSHADPHALVETNWLEEHLNDTDLCLLDCHVHLIPEDSGGFRLESGRPAWETGRFHHRPVRPAQRPAADDAAPRPICRRHDARRGECRHPRYSL